MTEREERTGDASEDARDPAREAAGQAAEDEGTPREGDERRATGHQDDEAAGED